MRMRVGLAAVFGKDYLPWGDIREVYSTGGILESSVIVNHGYFKRVVYM